MHTFCHSLSIDFGAICAANVRKFPRGPRPFELRMAFRNGRILDPYAVHFRAADGENHAWLCECHSLARARQEPQA